MNERTAWERIWDERGEKYPIDDPALINGYDQAFSYMDETAIKIMMQGIIEKLLLTSKDRLLEIGCGSGLLLNRLNSLVAACVGTDLSEGMVARARKIYPHLSVFQADSSRLDFSAGSFNKILANGVLQYFPDLNYASAVLDELIRVASPKARILVSDIMNKENKKEYLCFRAKLSESSESSWRSSINEPAEHLYCEKAFFLEYARNNKYVAACTVENRDVPGYLNASYRYDVILDLR
jgi:ubiquinone/menaquinone biosynthesis C-methylase UbiE